MSVLVQPFALRSSVSEDAGVLRISIPMKRSWGVILFLIFWLGMWQMGWRDAAGKLAHDPSQPFLLFWIGGWTLGGIWAVTWCMRMLAGRDIVTVKGDTFEIRKQVLALGLTRQYLRPEMLNLRFEPAMRRGRGHRASHIEFDYGARTIAFGDDLDEAEANQIIAKIQQHCKIAETVTGGSTLKFWQSS